MFKLTIPPVQRELDYYKWEVWEPLREREDFEHERFALYHDHEGNIRIPDPSEVDVFCEKWHITAPLDPRMSFDDLLLSAQTRARDTSLGISETRSKLAKAKRELGWIRDIKEFPNQLEIERARLKEIDELEQHIRLKEEEFQNLSDKEKKEMEKIWDDQAKRYIQRLFHLYLRPVNDNDIFFVRSKKRSPAFFGDDAAFIDPRDELIDGKYIKVTVNIERSKDRIQREVSRVLDEELKHYEPKQVPLESKEDKARAFAVWKLAKEGHSVKTTAYKLNLSEKTVKRQHKTAWEAIYPVRAYPGWPAKPKKAIHIKPLEDPCLICSETIKAEKCYKTGRPCGEALKFHSQDEELELLFGDSRHRSAFVPTNDEERESNIERQLGLKQLQEFQANEAQDIESDP